MSLIELLADPKSEIINSIELSLAIQQYIMGEAKRRQQLDPTYGTIPSLASSTQQQKHVDAIADELSQRFASEIKQIAAAESKIDTYDELRQTVSDWLHPKLNHYRESDRTLIASSIVTERVGEVSSPEPIEVLSMYAEIAMKYETSPLLIKFWFYILETYLSEEKRDRIATVVNKIATEFDLT